MILNTGMAEGFLADSPLGISNPALWRLVAEDLRKRLRGLSSILDLGCGTGVYGEFVRGYLPAYVFLAGVDGYGPCLEHPRIKRFYSMTARADVFDVVEGRCQVPTDCVLCMDVVEHLEKPKALRLLEWLRARRLAYVSTPLFWFPQDALQGNELERHRCWFDEWELNRLGWRTVVRAPIDQRGDAGAFRNVD